MRTASFWINHPESGSRVIVEFALQQGKVQCVGVGFILGNVVSLNDFSMCKKHAFKILAEGAPPLPFSG